MREQLAQDVLDPRLADRHHRLAADPVARRGIVQLKSSRCELVPHQPLRLDPAEPAGLHRNHVLRPARADERRDVRWLAVGPGEERHPRAVPRQQVVLHVLLVHRPDHQALDLRRRVRRRPGLEPRDPRLVANVEESGARAHVTPPPPGAAG